jgi:putative transposase
MSKDSTKTKERYRLPDKLWKILRKHLPPVSNVKKSGRPRAEDRKVLDGIGYVLWTGCQWKSIQKEWFGVSSRVLPERFQTWQSQGLFEKLFRTILK